MTFELDLLRGAYFVLSSGVFLNADGYDREAMAEYLQGPLEEVRTIHGRLILHCPLHESLGMRVNQFASELCQQRIFGHVAVMPIDSVTFTTSHPI